MEYLKLFSVWLRNHYTSYNTITSYESDVREFLAFFQGDIRYLNSSQINFYKQLLRDKHLKARSINRKLVALRQFIIFLNKECQFSIAIAIEPEKLQKVDYLETAVLTENEFYRIIDQAEKAKDTRAVAIMYTLYLTGMRISEMLQFKIYDVDADEFIVRGKGSKYRTIFIPDALKKIWSEYLPQRVNKTDYLFTGRKGPLSRGTVFKIIKKYTGLARVKLDKGHPHSFRHLYGYMAIKDGWSIDRLASQMGHSDINTTKIYTMPAKSEIKKEINRMASVRVRKKDILDINKKHIENTKI